MNMRHIEPERLRAVRDNDALMLTDAEYDHLLFCSDCFRDWWEYVLESIGETVS
jgi:hypothetical protein